MSADVDVDDGPDPFVLALNSGSSSLKFGLYRVQCGRVTPHIVGEASGLGSADGRFDASDGSGRVIAAERVSLDHQASSFERLTALLAEQGLGAPTAIGHRIVHGGPTLTRHCLIDADVQARLDGAAAFAPLHTPAALSLIRVAEAQYPGLPQVACFDTAFHAEMPEVARTLALPADLRERGVHRYGFHGLSCESIVRQLGDALPERLIVAHLGSGASITAVHRGRSIDTTMGLTPSGGLVMGTRSGDIDPGVLVYLARTMNLDAGALEDLVDHRSGLLAISGLSSDMRILHSASASDPKARLAIDMFCYSVRKHLAAMSMVLGGADMIVFTGGIGEHDHLVRASVGAGLASIGFALDEAANASGQERIDNEASQRRLRVMASKEDKQIALHTAALCGRRQ